MTTIEESESRGSAPSPRPRVDKSGDRVRAMFAGVARRYDLLNHVLSLNIDRRWRRLAVREVPAAPGASVLDVCTGTGDLALEYASQVEGSGRVVGADFCREMLEIAQHKGQRSGRSIDWVLADAQRLPFADNQFAIVSVAFGLRNIADTRAGLAEMIRVARPGGHVVILEFSRPRIPVLRWLYLAYFRYLLPAVGQAISRSRHEAYHYLPASVLEFPDGDEMADILRSMGLIDVWWRPLTLGIATLYVGAKP